ARVARAHRARGRRGVKRNPSLRGRTCPVVSAPVVGHPQQWRGRMKWQGRRGSDNIEDRRRMSAGRGAGIGGVGLLVILALGYFLNIDVTPLLNDPNLGGG